LATRLPSLWSPLAIVASRRFLGVPGTIAHCAQKRGYDRKQFKLQKKALKAARNQEDITFAQSLGVLREYTLGVPSLISAHIQIGQLESTKPLRGELELPKSLESVLEKTEASSKKPIVLVFATVCCFALVNAIFDTKRFENRDRMLFWPRN
jgi:hypothetical protein